METTKTQKRTLLPHKFQKKKISHKKMAEILLQLQVEINLYADTKPTRQKNVSATSISNPNSFLLHFEDSEFSLSLDLVMKGGAE